MDKKTYGISSTLFQDHYIFLSILLYSNRKLRMTFFGICFLIVLTSIRLLNSDGKVKSWCVPK